MVTPLYAEVSFDGRVVTLYGSGGRRSGDALYVSSDGIEGWHSTPDAKVSMTEMQTGDGAHAVEPAQVLYGARTVTLHWVAVGDARSGAIAGGLALLSTAHRLVRLRVVDSTSDTYVTGYTQVSADSGVATPVMTGTLTVVCPDPRRYSTATHVVTTLPTASSPGGLYYGASGSGLVYDLDYGGTPETLQNVAALANAGTSPAYPVVTLNGPLSGPSRVDWDGGSVGYSEAVGAVPVTLDSLTRTASVAGLDRSRYLTSRDFPVIPAGGSITLSTQLVGTGWATVEWHDTYI